jgi:hypothetical protein
MNDFSAMSETELHIMRRDVQRELDDRKRVKTNQQIEDEIDKNGGLAFRLGGQLDVDSDDIEIVMVQARARLTPFYFNLKTKELHRNKIEWVLPAFINANNLPSEDLLRTYETFESSGNKWEWKSDRPVKAEGDISLNVYFRLVDVDDLKLDHCIKFVRINDSEFLTYLQPDSVARITMSVYHWKESDDYNAMKSMAYLGDYSGWMEAHTSKSQRFRAAKTFIMTLMLSDGYFTTGNSHELASRFFLLMQKFPMEIQCLICNLQQGRNSAFISPNLINKTLRHCDLFQ